MQPLRSVVSWSWPKTWCFRVEFDALLHPRGHPRQALRLRQGAGTTSREEVASSEPQARSPEGALLASPPRWELTEVGKGETAPGVSDGLHQLLNDQCAPSLLPVAA